jgi:citrate lyase subunit gamma (acyl carrier protein)
MKIGIAGTFDSCDAFITVMESDKLEIEIESIVYAQFGEEIRKVITNTLNDLDINNIKVICKDKGALNYTIKARLITAISRMSDEHA